MRSDTTKSAAAWRVADRRRLTDDERYSFLHYHHEAVERLAAEAIPDLVLRADQAESTILPGEYVTLKIGSRTRQIKSPLPAGWLTWFGNRRVGIRDRWFRLTWHY